MKFKQLFEAEEEKSRELKKIPSNIDAKWWKRFLKKKAEMNPPKFATVDQQHDFDFTLHEDEGFTPEELKQMEITNKKFLKHSMKDQYIHKMISYKKIDPSGSIGHEHLKKFTINPEWNYPQFTKFLYDDKGKFHAEGEPAVILRNGIQEWWNHGERHRTDGPAIEGPKGKKEWWINNKLAKTGYSGFTVTDDEKWELIRGNPENIEAIDRPTKEMQEYIIKKRPDLIRLIDHLSKEMIDKYGYNLDTSGIEL